jgi:murE/murF fusion protein
VFGCGGDRDPTKRPLMAAVAEKNADRVVVTSDNPRSEKPEAIISQVLLGLSHAECVQVEVDRARAIAETVATAGPQDVILLAGKGHEDYQEIAGVKHRFSDQAHARRALEGANEHVRAAASRRLGAWPPGRRRQDRVQRVHTDTRTLQPGDLFVALKGERFDANDFIAQARDKGAVAAIAQPGRLPAGFPGIEVPTAPLPWAGSPPHGAASSRWR